MGSRSPLARFLTALYGDAPRGSFIELRYHSGEHMSRAFFAAEGLAAVSAAIMSLSAHTDVYAGVIPRRRRGGGRADLVSAAPVVWTDCDTEESAAMLRSFIPAPSWSVRSGSGENLHGYWLLSEHVVLADVEAANRRLAYTLGADARCTDAARIMRPVSSLNWKHDPPVEVRLASWNDGMRYPLADILAGLAELPPPLNREQGASDGRMESAADPLLAIHPAAYVECLTGVSVPRSGKITCPFHDDHTPSLHVYEDPQHGWYCYGCGRGGSVYDFAAAMWDLPARGKDFIELRERLSEVFGER